MSRVAVLCSVALLLSALGCEDAPVKAGPRLRVWHTFNPAETQALNELLAAPGQPDVQATVIPFSRGRAILEHALSDPETCPDLARIDATWLPALVAAGALSPVPEKVARKRAWLDPARALATIDGKMMAVPQALDGLVLIYREDSVRAAGGLWPPATMGELFAAGHRLSQGQKSGLGIRVDGYWFWAFARGFGAPLFSATGEITVDSPEAKAALLRFAQLFGENGIAPEPPPKGDAARIHAASFLAGDLAAVMSGPWAVSALAGDDIARLRAAPFPPAPDKSGAAPLGAQLFAVPTCARHKAAAFALALALTDPALQAAWSRTLATVPVTRAGLAAASPLARRFYDALAGNKPLPRHPATPALFDDLSPAVAAVVAGDATADEALAGVARGWARILATSP